MKNRQRLIFYHNFPKISSKNITIKDIQKYRIRKDTTPKGDGNPLSFFNLKILVMFFIRKDTTPKGDGNSTAISSYFFNTHKKRHNSERRRKRWLSLGLINLIRSPIRNDITPKGDGNPIYMVIIIVDFH